MICIALNFWPFRNAWLMWPYGKYASNSRSYAGKLQFKCEREEKRQNSIIQSKARLYTSRNDCTEVRSPRGQRLVFSSKTLAAVELRFESRDILVRSRGGF